MITLPNGKSIDLDLLETAMEDSEAVCKGLRSYFELSVAA
jgi:hypothetical protein